MSCPDWRSAAAWRDGDGPAPSGWAADLEHLAGCARCRRRVAELDPALLLAASAASTPALDDQESAVLRDTVRSLVAAERLRAGGRGDRKALVAAAALAALLAAPLGWSRLAGRTVAPAASPELAAALAEPVDVPPVEEVQPAGARVYQLGTDELPVVLIFDENLDL